MHIEFFEQIYDEKSESQSREDPTHFYPIIMLPINPISTGWRERGVPDRRQI